jgi:mono/diheme cytochrome c family protein
MTRLLRWLCVLGLIAALVVAPRSIDPPVSAAPALKASVPNYSKDVAPLVAKYCVDCHGPQKKRAGLRLDLFKTPEDIAKGQQVWEKVADNLRAGDMPPAGRKRPTQAEMDTINAWLDAVVFKIDCSQKDPGRVTIRRLNRAEYNNTIRDLTAVDFHPANDFPSDDVGYGFDNIGDVLSMSPLLMEKYLAAAEKILDRAIVQEQVVHSSKQLFRPQNLVIRPFNARDKAERRIIFTTAGEAYLQKFHFSHEGDYIVRVRAHGELAGSDHPHLSIRVADKEVKGFDVGNTESKTFEARTHVKEGEGKVAAAFTNPFKDTKDKDPKKHHERKLIVETIEVEGPFNVPPKPLPESHRRIMIAKPTGPGDREAAASKVIENFARRAYRRPVTRDEVERLLKLFRMAEANKEPFEKGVKLALEAVLVSPHFLFRIEADREPNNPDTITLISEYELATRLSYFLWSSMPDEELFKLARDGQLRKPGVIEAQIKRLLKDPKSKALFDNFANQWLTLRNLKEFKPDPKRFPTFNDQLRDDLIEETRQFFNHVVRDDRSVLELLDAKYTFVNERLAKHYGLPSVRGDEFRQVTLTDEQHKQRGGILMMGSVLAVTSNPTRTSPVKRGKFILENILNTPPPPPPPDVPELKEGAELKGTLRQRMEQHRANPTCASCHQRMDPLGFGFENFDAVGAWRTADGKEAIDASGVLPGGKEFSGADELRSILLERKDTFTRCLADRLLTYALGRGMKRSDQCFTDEIAKNLAKRDYKFSALVIEIVKSDPFQKRRGKREKP